MLKRIWGGNGPAGMCIAWMIRCAACLKENLITHYPQPSRCGTKQEHTAVSAGLNDGAQQGAISKGAQRGPVCCDTALQERAKTLDQRGGPGGKIGQGALFDPASLAKTLAQQDGGRRAAIGYRFDIHGVIFSSL